MTDATANATEPSTDERGTGTTEGGPGIEKQEVLRATDDGPISTVDQPGKRRVLRGALASAGAALGLPLLGSSGASAAGEPEEIIDAYSRADAVGDVLDQNEELLAVLDELRLVPGYQGAGLQVSAISVDGEYVPQLVVYVAADAGMLSIVVSPDEVPPAPRTFVVTTEEKMAESPVEWPGEKRTEFPEEGILFEVGQDGWVDPESVLPEPTDHQELIDKACDDPAETGCGPVEDDTCWFRGCCGVVQGRQCYDGFGDSESSMFAQDCDEWEEERDGVICWEKGVTCTCEENPILIE